MWLRNIRGGDPSTPGMDARSPRASWRAISCMMLALALQVVLRYETGFLSDNRWQFLHVFIGLGTCFGLMRVFHGPAFLSRIGRRTWMHLLIALTAFFLFWYLGRMDSFQRWWQPHVDPSDAFAPVYAFIYFSSASTLLRLILPFALVWLLFRQGPHELGLSAKHNPYTSRARPLWPLYFALYIGVLPFVLYVADTAPFLAKYPLGRAMVQGGQIEATHLLVHECFYLLIFISGEAFWRGFLTFGLERDFGLYTLPLMIVPYVTAHFGKPMLETLGAIIAGGLLGWLALKHRSIWLGVALHYAVAITMDLLAIHHNGFTIKLP